MHASYRLAQVVTRRAHGLCTYGFGSYPNALELVVSDESPGIEITERTGAPRGVGELRLVVVGNATTSFFSLPKLGEVTIGRAHDCAVRVADDPSVSRKHVKLRMAGRDVVVIDLGSANGTLLGVRRLVPHAPAPLVPGEVVTIGGTTIVVQALSTSDPPLDPRADERPHSNTSRRLATLSAAPVREVAASSGAIESLRPMIERIAAGSITVLILGETGVGKEVLANEIHRLSARANKPLLSLNCAALSESLLESELFGHERGAFTGAISSKAGLLESANGGTVFLDELGDMPSSLQAKLLRVIEQRQVTRIGSVTPRPIDVRFIAATNRDLEEDVAAGRFRKDLYFRLNGASVSVPPLRERIDEIETLATHFIRHFASQYNAQKHPRIAPETLELLRRHHWPGNVRELRNVIERAVLLASDVILPTHLPLERMGLAAPSTPSKPRIPSVPAIVRYDEDDVETDGRRDSAPTIELAAAASSQEPGSVDGPSDEDERERIMRALEQCAGNQTQAAKMLGVARRTLISRIERYELPRPRKPQR